MNRPEPTASVSPDERARRVAEAMRAAGRPMKWPGLRLDSVAPGRAGMSMIVEAHHASSHGICHGGIIFTLAASAFGFACNGHNRRRTVAAQKRDQLRGAGARGRPAPRRERRGGAAVEAVRPGPSGIYDVTVANGENAVVAVTRGHAREMGGAHIEEE